MIVSPWKDFSGRRSALTGVLLGCLVTSMSATSEGTRLVLQLTVDGMRNDLLTGNSARFDGGGFRYLLDGVVFANAHYEHANTETIVGHASLASGAHPARHGMTGNVWYDADSGELAYNIEDPDHPLLPTRTEAVKGDQVDPAQRMARTAGRSPRSLLVETIADRMTVASAGSARVFAVSGKDRSAVAMAGQSGKALWFSSDSGDFVSSSYYFDAYPAWVAGWNEKRRAESWSRKTWELLHPIGSYRAGDRDDRPYETDLKGYGRTFPHRFGTIESKLLPTQLVASPVGDRLLAEFAVALMDNELMGRDATPDYLSISFSGIDAVNHFFGPASLETEDAVLQLDRTLAYLLKEVDRAVGLQNTLIVLSADHGAAEMPEHMAEHGIVADRLYPDVITDAVQRIAEARWQLGDVVRFYYRPYVYLNREAITEAGLDLEAVSATIADELSRESGVALAITPAMLARAPDSRLIYQVRNNYHPSRSGDIYVVQAPYWFNFDRGPVAAMHGSPWNYDTHVPLIFAGGGISGRTIHRRVQPIDVAPTITALLGITPPASATGTVLEDVTRQ